MPDYLEQRRNRWYATFTVPDELKGKHGLPYRFVKSTGTGDKSKARAIASQLVAGWKLLIEQAKGSDTAALTEAIQFRAELEKAKDAERRETLEYVLLDRAEGISAEHGEAKAKEFYAIATGTVTTTKQYFDAWKAQLHHIQKTREQMEKDVSLFIARFPLTSDVSKQNVKAWLDDLASKGFTLSSRRRILSWSKNFWKYLQQRDIVSIEYDPFISIIPPAKKAKGNDKPDPWVPFTPEEVVELWTEARRIEELALADLIAPGAYTGGRIEELCSLDVKDVTETSMLLDSKSEAGRRYVPIHSAIAPLVKRLKAASTDGYLLSGLTFNKYGDRSNAIGKRFGRLKTRLGHDGQHVFHSIRKTIVTLLENAGVSENLAADIVGHEKPRVTYGLYSGGATLEVKKEAIERVAYPFPTLS